MWGNSLLAPYDKAGVRKEMVEFRVKTYQWLGPRTVVLAEGHENILRLPEWRGMPGSREGSDTATMSKKVGVEGETQYRWMMDGKESKELPRSLERRHRYVATSLCEVVATRRPFEATPQGVGCR